jgi:hypothetical protein
LIEGLNDGRQALSIYGGLSLHMMTQQMHVEELSFHVLNPEAKSRIVLLLTWIQNTHKVDVRTLYLIEVGNDRARFEIGK